MIKRAKTPQIVHILPLVESFVKESAWDWEYDKQASIDTLKDYISNEDADVFLAIDGGDIVGFALVAYDCEFHSDKIGYVTKFYMKERGTPLSRELVKNCCSWFDANECDDSFATATANIDSEGKAFSNLMGKFGFKDCGQTMVRRHE